VHGFGHSHEEPGRKEEKIQKERDAGSKRHGSTVVSVRGGIIQKTELRKVPQNRPKKQERRKGRRDKKEGDRGERREVKGGEERVHGRFELGRFFGFFFEFETFFFQILKKRFAAENRDIRGERDYDAEKDVSDEVEDGPVIRGERDAERNDGRRPEDRSRNVVYPEAFWMHVAGSRNERNERAGEVVEFSKEDEPCAVFRDLPFQVPKFGSSDPENIAIFAEKRLSVPLSKRVPHEIADYRSNGGNGDHFGKVFAAKKSSDKQKHLHSGNHRTDNRERFDNGENEGEQVVPVPDSEHERFDGS
jgi:hypothetical protein